MDIRDVELLKELTTYAEKKTTAILQLIAEIWTLKEDRGRAAHYSSFVGIDGDTVNCEGDEYWRYGGHEKHSISFPTDWLAYSLDDIREIETGRKTDEDVKKELEASKKLEATEARERAELARLQEKYADKPTLTELMR